MFSGFTGDNCEIPVGGTTTPGTVTTAPPTTPFDIIDFISSVVGSVAGLTDEQLEQFIALVLEASFNLQNAGALGKYKFVYVCSYILH